MTSLKRIPIKYIRDFIKKDYKARDECFVCGSTDKLELHHIYSVSELFNKWCAKRNIDPLNMTVEDIKGYREQFYQDEIEYLNNDNLYTLCKPHHERLHNIYGQRYGNHMAAKVIRWLTIQREKNGR